MLVVFEEESSTSILSTGKVKKTFSGDNNLKDGVVVDDKNID